MKKISVFFVLCMMFSTAVNAESLLNTQDSFLVAKAFKLGRERGAGFDNNSAVISGGGGSGDTHNICPSNCSKCNDAGQCEACVDGYLARNGSCVNCADVINGCSLCSSASTCIKCKKWYYLSSNQCRTCPDNATCPGDETIKCYDGYALNDAGNACVEVPKTCAAVVSKEKTDVAVVTDSASFTQALSSGKSIIMINGNVSGLPTTDLGSKKLVGPKYFADIDLCKNETTPTATFASSANMTISGGAINKLDLTFTMEDKTKYAISGSGTIKDSTITTKLNKGVVSASGKITLAGDVTLKNQLNDDDNYANTYILTTQGGSVEITGTTTLGGKASYGLGLGASTTATISSTGTLILNMPGVFVGIDLENYSTFTANGPVKFEQPASSAIGYISVYESYINLNANGNYIKTTYTGLMETSGMIKVNGSTTIECFIKQGDNSPCKAISADHTYGDIPTKLEINAPVTVKGMTRDIDSRYPNSTGDTLLYAKGDSIKLNSSIESTTGIGKVFINTDSANFTSSAAILGAKYMSGYNKPISVSAGAKLKLNGVCKKATSSGTLTLGYDNGITSPVSPFTGGC